ncbi:deoxyribose-phosphate aldolase, partial [Streptococcus danieliae]|nr:deoxyribose-phosphate aldolase [Streptococcus danieliae]
MKLNKYIDHTLLKATARKEEIETLCKEAKEFDFFSVCVNSSYIEFCKEQLRGTDVKIAAVVGFPLGSMSTEAKVFEAKDAIEKGANEIDMVLNISRLLDGDYSYVEDEIRAIKEAIG